MDIASFHPPLERKPPGPKEFGIKVKVPDESLEQNIFKSMHSTFDYRSLSSSSDEASDDSSDEKNCSNLKISSALASSDNSDEDEKEEDEDEDSETEISAVSENGENEEVDKRDGEKDENFKCKEDNWSEVDESEEGNESQADSVLFEPGPPDQNLIEPFALSNIQTDLETFHELCVRCVKYEDGQKINGQALRLYKEGFRDRAIHEFKWAAKHCHSISAYYNLGLCFMEKQDFMKALRYYKEAADKGHVIANYNIAYIILTYRTKLETKYSEADGIMFLKKAAELGLKQAQAEYGIILLEKKDTADVAERAAGFLELAVRQKYPQAMYLLGCCFEKGLGVEVNCAKAADLYARASHGQHPIAQHNLGVFFELGLGGLIKNKEEAMNWYQEAVKNGHQESMNDAERLTGMDASNGSSVPQCCYEVTVVAEQPATFQDKSSHFFKSTTTQRPSQHSMDTVPEFHAKAPKMNVFSNKMTKGDRIPNPMPLASQFDIDDVSSSLDVE